MIEIFLSLTSAEVEAFNADLVIAAAGKHEVLLRNEPYRVDDRVLDVAIDLFSPHELDQRLIELTHVPDLNTLAKSAATGDTVVITVAHIDRITAD